MRLSKLRKAGLFAAAIMLSYTLSAQTEVRKLLLNEAIQLAEENNKTLKESELNKNIASEKYNQSYSLVYRQPLECIRIQSATGNRNSSRL